MKSAIILSVLTALAGSAAAIPHLRARQAGDGGGKVADPAGVPPSRQELPSRQPFVPGSKTLKIRYGAYQVNGMMQRNSHGQPGMLHNYADRFVEKPCESCMVIGISVGYEYPDGREANTDTNMWLHHMVMYNEGQDAADATAVTVAPETCDSHTTIGSTASKSERWYASGNERSHSAFNMNLPNNTIWNGYPLYPSDNFHFKIELMNMNHEAQIGYVTVTYDIVEGHPENFREIKPVWLDAALCTGTGSEITAPQQSGKFSVVAEPWVATFDGAILGIAGHVHDGGVGVRFEVDGQHVCDSVATYGSTSGSISPKPMMGGGATVHVSAMSTCIGPLLPVKELKKGQKWTLIADYDYDKHLGILEEDGKQSDIMGIALLFALRSDKRQAS